MKKSPYKRRKKGLTNYSKRLRLVKSKLPRAAVRTSDKYVTCQVINYSAKGDITLASFNSKSLNKFGFPGSKNLPSAYLTGLACGIKAKKAGVKKTVLDTGLKVNIKGSRIYAALKGLLDAGLSIEHDPSVLPKDDRLKGVKLKSGKLFEGARDKIIKGDK